MATATVDTTRRQGSSRTITVVGGLMGGAAGGMVFGMLMQMMGAMSMIAMLVGSESTAVGWGVHMAISMFIGALFGLIIGTSVRLPGALVGLGVAYGMIWWVLGALVLMPAKLGMPLFGFDALAWKSLMGHMIFGAILGGVTAYWVRRTRPSA